MLDSQSTRSIIHNNFPSHEMTKPYRLMRLSKKISTKIQTTNYFSTIATQETRKFNTQLGNAFYCASLCSLLSFCGLL